MIAFFSVFLKEDVSIAIPSFNKFSVKILKYYEFQSNSVNEAMQHNIKN